MADDNKFKYSFVRRESLDDNLGPKWKFWRRRRMLLVIMAFFGFLNVYSNRIDLSVAITAMVKGHGNSQTGDFDWDSETEGYVLSSFFYGYITLQFVGGYMASKHGGIRLFGFGVGIPSFLSIFTEYFAKAHYGALIALRIAEGIIQGMCYPSMHDVWAHWLPPLERTGFTAFAYSGAYVGCILAMSLSGIIAKYLWWPVVFLLFGGLGTVWYGIWLSYAYRTPEEDPYIYSREFNFLKLHVDVKHEIVHHPWKKIFSSPPVYALIVSHFSINWGTYTLLTQLPMFMQDVLKYDIAEAGLLSSMPYILMVVSMIFTGNIADYILVRGLLSVTKVRKIFIATGFIFEGTLLFFVGFTDTPVATLVLLTLAVAGASLSEPNYFVNHLDIAPRHASVLLGITNTIATIPGIVSPTLTGYLVQNKTRKEWRVVFIITAGIYWFAAIFYLIFGTGKLQDWALKHEEENEQEER